MPAARDPRSTPTKPFSQPFLGLHLDRPAWNIDPRGFADCNNVRIASGRVDSRLSGWHGLLNVALDGKPIRGVFEALPIDTTPDNAYLIVATTTDAFLVAQNAVLYATPIYGTGTVAVSGTTVTGTGTLWNTSIGNNYRTNARVGDQIAFNSPSLIVGGATWYTITAVNSDTSLTLSSSPGTISAGNVYIIRQCLSTTDPLGLGEYFWNFEVYPGAGAPDNADLLIATNGHPSDCIMKFSLSTGASHFVYESAMPFQASCLRRFKNLMIYGNLVQPGALQTFLPTSFANSDNGLPFAMASGVAGQYVVSDGPLAIDEIDVLGNTLMFYMGSPLGGDVIGGNFVGPPTNFVFTEIIRGRGPISGRCVAAFPDRHQFLTPEGEYRYNGLYIQPMNMQLWRGLTGLLDYTRTARAHCTINPILGDLVWAVPLTTDSGQLIETAYVEHYMEQANNYLFKPFTKRDWPFTAACLGWAPGPTQASAINSPQPITVVGDENGALWQAFASGNQGATLSGTGGVAPTSSVTFPQRFTVNERSRGLVKRVYPFVEQMAGGSPSLTVTLTMFDRTGGAATITDAQTFDPTSPETRFTSHFRRGRLGQVTLSGPSGWVLDGGDWDVVPGGLR